MRTIVIDETKLLEEIRSLEEKRDVHSVLSAEYIEIDEQIKLIIRLISFCKIK